MALLRCKYKL